MSQTAHNTTTWVTLVAETCFKCGIAFGMPDDYKKKRLEDHKAFYCPNGHGQVYVDKTEAQKLREQLEVERRRLKYEREQKESVRRSLAATRGVLTRTKNRIAAGDLPLLQEGVQGAREAHGEGAPGVPERSRGGVSR